IWPWFDSVQQDVTSALRQMWRAPGLTFIIVAVLALGIGAATAVFSIMEAVLLRPLPYAHVDRLVAIWDGHVKDQNLGKVFASYDDFETWTQHSQQFEQFAAATWAPGNQI